MKVVCPCCGVPLVIAVAVGRDDDHAAEVAIVRRERPTPSIFTIPDPAATWAYTGPTIQTGDVSSDG